MFVTLILFAVAVAALFIAVTRLLRSLMRRIVGGKDKGREEAKDEGTGKKKGKSSGKEKEEDEQQEQVQEREEDVELTPEQLEERLGPEMRDRYQASCTFGITEEWWKDPSGVSLRGKDIADMVVDNSSLSFLEYNNRMLADESFGGFNIMLEDGRKMTLTYQGTAVATLTRVESRVVVDKKVTDQVRVIYRTNLFPPRLTPQTTFFDVKRILEAQDRISMCQGDPEKVCERMIGEFTRWENVSELKRNVDPKIQARESRRARPQEDTPTRQPRRRL